MSDDKVPPQNPSEDKPADEPGATPAPGGAAGTGGSGASAPPPPSSSGADAGAPPPPPSGGGTGGTGAGGSAPPPPRSGAGGPSGPASQNRGLMLVLSYLWVLALIPYLVEQEDPEVKWHARHGLVLLVAEIVLGVVLFILSLVPGVGCIFSILWMLITLGLIVLHVILLVKALNGERYRIPYVTQYVDQIP